MDNEKSVNAFWLENLEQKLPEDIKKLDALDALLARACTTEGDNRALAIKRSLKLVEELRRDLFNILSPF